MSDEREQAVAIFAGALRISRQDVPEQPLLGQTEGWDSLAHLNLILALEEALGRELNPEQVVEIESLDDVVAILENASISNDQAL